MENSDIKDTIEHKSRKKSYVLKAIWNIFMVTGIVGLLGYVFNFYFSIGYLLIILVHEFGHYLAGRWLKVKIRFGNLTPFGAYVIHEELDNCKYSAIIAIAGPFIGYILAIIYFFIYFLTKDNTFLILSYVSVILNLVNLIPAKPLDGGNIAATISPVLCYIGLPFLFYFAFIQHTTRMKSKIIRIILLIVGIFQTYDLRKKYYKDAYYKIDKNTKIKFMLVYALLLLILILSAGYFYYVYDIKNLFNTIVRLKKV